MRIKRFGALFLSLIIVFSLIGGILPAAAFAEGDGDTMTITIASADAVEVSSPEDLFQLAQEPGGNYILTNDIDMTGIDWEPIAFSGTFNGDGHTIYNLSVTKTGTAHADTIDGNAKVYDTVFAGFFSALTDALVENLNLRGADINIESSDHCFVGTIAGYITNSEVYNCKVLDTRATIRSTIQPDPANPRTSCNAGVGGIVGFASGGMIRDCTADTVLVFTDLCSRELKVEEFMGGALSCGNASVIGCDITIDGYDECRGYVHNGGLIGMFYQINRDETPDTISVNSVKGMITFFEDNPDRRAYCEPFIGEIMTWPYLRENTESFTRNETMDYTSKLTPEKCAAPSVIDTVYPPGCNDCGYSVHSCNGCGNIWLDSFTLPSHTPGEWVIVSDPKNGVDGIRRLSCSKCGEILGEETLKAVQSVSIDKTALELDYKDSASLNASVEPADAVDKQIHWTSSDTEVATVDQEGNVHAAGRGTAVITAESADGYAKSTCEVKVGYSFKQWLIKILLFGWIWY